MAKVIDITERLSNTKPVIKINGKEYVVNDSIEAMFKFESLGSKGSKGMIDAVELAIGKEAAKEIGVEKLSVSNFKVLTTAIMAAMQGLSYEEAEARFQKQQQ